MNPSAMAPTHMTVPTLHLNKQGQTAFTQDTSQVNKSINFQNKGQSQKRTGRTKTDSQTNTSLTLKIHIFFRWLKSFSQHLQEIFLFQIE